MRRYCSSLLYYDGIVYMANDVGVLTAVDAANGQRVWQERVDGVFSASPVGGGGHVYFVSEDGNTVVLKGGRAPQVVARNDVGERMLASPAISGGRLFLRTDEHLIAIGVASDTVSSECTTLPALSMDGIPVSDGARSGDEVRYSDGARPPRAEKLREGHGRGRRRSVVVL